MKITQKSQDEIQAKTSGTTSLIIGIVMTIVGIGGTLFVLLTQNDKTFAIFTAILAAIGLSLLFSASKEEIVIHKAGPSWVEKTYLILKKKQRYDFDTTNAQMVELRASTRTSTDNNGNRSQDNRGQIIIHTANNDEVVVKTASKQANRMSVGGIGIDSLIDNTPLKSEANQIADYLGVPMQFNNTSSLLGAAKTAMNFFDNFISKKNNSETTANIAPGQTAAQPNTTQPISTAPSNPQPTTPSQSPITPLPTTQSPTTQSPTQPVATQSFIEPTNQQQAAAQTIAAQSTAHQQSTAQAPTQPEATFEAAQSPAIQPVQQQPQAPTVQPTSVEPSISVPTQNPISPEYPPQR